MSPTPPLSLPDDWVETEYETDAYGPDDVDGVDAQFDLGDDTHLAVRPMLYRRESGEEFVRGLTTDYEFELFNPDAPGDVPRRTVFAVQFGFRTAGRPTEGVFCLCTDPDDAVAVAVSLAAVTGGPRDLRNHVRRHEGEGRGTRVTPSDPEALGRTLAAVGPDPEPDRCLFSDTQTRSHRVSIPVRYATAIADYPRTEAGMVRVHHRCRDLRAAVSHREWTDRNLGSVPFDAGLERVEAGRFRLEPSVSDTLADVDPELLTLATF